ncbi:MAG: BMP family protein [Streptococcus mitis]|nr:BMP family protein [Streptococcus mitis]
MNKKQWLGLGLVAVAAVGLAACGNRSSRKADSSSDVKTKAAIVTDTGGVDDKSFNQSAWEGLQAWGKEHNLAKDKGFTYFQSTSEADYANNLQQAAGSYNLIFGVGFALHNAVEEAAKDHSDLNYVLIDDVIKDQKNNVVSVTFADNESAYLAGVAAAKTTKTKQVGFVGGIESEVISRFAAGFKAGVESVDPSIKVQVDYAGSFGDAAKGKTIAAAQYAAGADVVYQAAGGTGAGVFAEAKSLNESRSESEKVWVIGVDRDQVAEGKYTSKDGKESNFVLVSTLKQVGTTVKDIANKAEKGEFPGGQVIVYSLKDKGVDLAVTNLSEEGKKAVEDAKAKILDGSVKVPEK